MTMEKQFLGSLANVKKVCLQFTISAATFSELNAWKDYCRSRESRQSPSTPSSQYAINVLITDCPGFQSQYVSPITTRLDILSHHFGQRPHTTISIQTNITV